MKIFRRSSLVVILSLGALHCSSSDTPGTTPDTSTDAGAHADSSAASDSSAAPDTSPAVDASTVTPDAADANTGPLPVNGCAVADLAASDHTAPSDTRAITFPADGQGAAQYSTPCMTVRVGQSVTWTGGFTTHPLEPANGDANNPIVLTKGVATKSFAFPAAGTFGFECQNHPGLMRGAIRVIP